VIVASGRQIEIDDLPPAISKMADEIDAHTKNERIRAASEGRSINLEIEFPATIDEIEKQAIELAIGYTSGDKSRASKLLGIGRKTLYRKLEEYGKVENDS
jgi:two-component system, NtrC family, response regulator HydG